MYDVHAKVPKPLIADARRQAPHLGLGAVVRLALARFAGWPDGAVQAVTGERGPRPAHPDAGRS